METIYLGLLRGFILVAATLALLSAVILTATAIPSLLTRMGITQSDAPSLSLQEFIAERKPQESSSNSDDEGSSAELVVDPVISQAAENFHSYIGKRGKGTLATWRQGLQATQNEIPVAAMSGYAQSLLTLSTELKASRGKPLSENRVFELVDWQKQRFVATYEQRIIEKQAADAAFLYKLGAAFAAILLFVFVAFIFLFVRIERNTRLVRTVQVQDA